MLRVYPILIFLFSAAVLTTCVWLGVSVLRRLREQAEKVQEEFGIIQGATLTLLGLIIGFTFSMALGRYDQRKDYEEEEANAIGTEYLRAELLPAGDAARVQSLLREYLDQRILFYTTRDEDALATISAKTSDLQAQLWAAVKGPATAQPTPLSALAAAGMNDVINTQGYTQAAWWNRIPFAAWALMLAIAICTTLLLGVGARRRDRFPKVLLVLPLVISIAFFMIADLDSPRRGVIRVVPMNLEALAASLRQAH